MNRVFAAVSTLVVLASPVAAQDHKAHPSHAVHDSVMAPIKALFDGMRTRDTALMRSAFAPGAMMGGVPRAGQPVRFEQVDGFLKAIAGAPAGTLLDEQLYDVDVRIDGGLASVWAFYTFSLGERFSHCGVDAFQVVRTDAGWKITALADTRRQQDCSVEGKKKA